MSHFVLMQTVPHVEILNVDNEIRMFHFIVFLCLLIKTSPCNFATVSHKFCIRYFKKDCSEQQLLSKDDLGLLPSSGIN